MATMVTEITVKDDKDKLEDILSKVGAIRQNVIAAVRPKAINKAKMIVRGAVDAYYGSYSPRVYGRTESLYSVMKP